MEAEDPNAVTARPFDLEFDRVTVSIGTDNTFAERSESEPLDQRVAALREVPNRLKLRRHRL
jgi:hypothetical protein